MRITNTRFTLIAKLALIFLVRKAKRNATAGVGVPLRDESQPSGKRKKLFALGEEKVVPDIIVLQLLVGEIFGVPFKLTFEIYLFIYLFIFVP